MRSRAYIVVSRVAYARTSVPGQVRGATGDAQGSQPRLETVLEEYPLLLLGPLDVRLGHLHLRRLAVGYLCKEVEQCSDWRTRQSITRPQLKHRSSDALSFAVFAFAVDDTNARDLLITSATPCAFLLGGVRQREHTEEQRARRRTSGRDTARRA